MRAGFESLKSEMRQRITALLCPEKPATSHRPRVLPLPPRARVALQLEAMVALAELRLELTRDLKAYIESLPPEEREALRSEIEPTQEGQ